MAARKSKILVAAAAGTLWLCLITNWLQAQDSNLAVQSPEPKFDSADEGNQSGWLFLPYAQFKIPFNIESGSAAPSQVQLWVSTDEGTTWQPHSKSASDKRFFEFRAASEGSYLFGVQTRDASGNSYPSTQPPMRVIVDTTRPQVSIDADMDSSGRVIAQFEINDQYLDTDSIRVQYRCDQDSNWSDASVQGLNRSGEVYRGLAVIAPGRCREVLLRLTLADLAQNKGEAALNYKMPRTASAPSGLQLASQRDGNSAVPQFDVRRNSVSALQSASPFGVGPTPGATQWSANNSKPANGAPASATQPPKSTVSGFPTTQLPNKSNVTNLGVWVDARSKSSPNSTGPAGSNNSSERIALDPRMPSTGSLVTSSKPNEPLALPEPAKPSAADSIPGGNFPVRAMTNAEELPAPPEVHAPNNTLTLNPSPTPGSKRPPEGVSAREEVPTGEQPASDGLGENGMTRSADSHLSQAYHSRSRAFSLDYSVDTLKSSQVADIELWGTEDGGRSWVQWGSDPDRQSPFDVQVADDGLFGFRMVVVGGNGLVSNRPKDGDDADMWINVDSISPDVKITRAVYGEGHEAGMLVIDYKCDDGNLHDRPVTISFSDHQNGPWTTIVSGLRNTGIYLWKPGNDLPKKVYLRIEATDRGGNIGTHRLDLPIAVEGLAPRGRIQGFRPLDAP